MSLVFFPILSLLLLASHVLRSGSLLLVGATLAMLGLLAVRRPCSARIVQVVLVLGAAEWVRTLIVLMSRRIQQDQPTGRLVLILGAVAAVTLISALLFQTRPLRRAYGLIRADGGSRPHRTGGEQRDG